MKKFIFGWWMDGWMDVVVTEAGFKGLLSEVQKNKSKSMNQIRF